MSKINFYILINLFELYLVLKKFEASVGGDNVQKNIGS